MNHDDQSQILKKKSIREFGHIQAQARTHRHGQIARQKSVLEDTPVGDVDALAFICYDDHRPT